MAGDAGHHDGSPTMGSFRKAAPFGNSNESADTPFEHELLVNTQPQGRFESAELVHPEWRL